ncbi:MAG TPA: hypothetical protein VE553_09520 [Candidatus Binatia bacterium]|nr:hypothetical protein [Candidatus Binatia bacterium]
MTMELVQRSEAQVGAGQAPPAGLPALMQLFAELNRQGLRYCHWKSNVRLQEALNGKTDLDLLVDAHQKKRFEQVMVAHGLKALQAARGKAYPGVENYLGLDHASGRLFHLHVHYQLILGEQFVKNVVLPLEKRFLDSAAPEHSVMVPAPELELIVFSMRALLKYRDRDALKDLLGIRSPGVPKAILQEVHWLLSRTTLDRVRQTLQALHEIVPGDIVLSFLDIVTGKPRDGVRLFRQRSRLRRALRPYRRHTQLRASLIYFRELWSRSRSPKKMRLPHRGRSLALIGADGAGKSTMCKMLRQWLSWKVDVRLFYLGSKQPSRRSEILYLLFRLFRRSHRSLGRLLGMQSAVAKRLDIWRQSLLYRHQLSLANDRYRRYRVGRHLAEAGVVVIYDRFPLAPKLDGPKIEALAGGEPADPATPDLVKRFGPREQAVYDAFELPDHVFLLDVTPDVSLARKPDHDRAAVEAKYRLLQEMMAKCAPQIVCVDANQELEDVVLDLKRAVWQAL